MKELSEHQRRAAEITAKICGRTVEEIEAMVEENEKKNKETVRILSVSEVNSAVGSALLEILGDLTFLIGPAVMYKVKHELFDKQEGE